MRLRYALAAVGLFTASFIAHADTTQYLTLTSFSPDTYSGGGGTMILSGNIDPQGYSSLSLTGLQATLDGFQLGAASGYETYELGQLTQITIYAFASDGPNTLEFFLNPGGLLPSAGSFGYSMYAQYDDPDTSFYDSGTASLSSTAPSAVTPEPSSFALLGTGLLGVAGTLKRRFV